MLAVAKFSSSDEQPAPENQGGGAGDDENPEQGLGFYNSPAIVRRNLKDPP